MWFSMQDCHSLRAAKGNNECSELSTTERAQERLFMHFIVMTRRWVYTTYSKAKTVVTR